MNLSIARSHSPQWRRVAAWSTSFTLHLGAAVALALPFATQPERQLPIVVEATMRSEPPPAPPIPPEPAPPAHAHAPTRAPVHRAPAREMPVLVATPTATPVANATPPVDATPLASNEATPPQPDSGNAAGSGESRQLAYAGALQLRYPPASLRLREQGTVLLRVRVDADGGVTLIEVARSSGHANLDAAAREAVQRTRFRPVLQDGQAVPAWGIVPIEFRLDQA